MAWRQAQLGGLQGACKVPAEPRGSANLLQSLPCTETRIGEPLSSETVVKLGEASRVVLALL